MNFAPLPAVDAAAVPSDGYLLDVRENDEWSVGHAPEAVHIPMSELVARTAELPADRTIHVVCRVGGRSAQVAQYLIAQGVDAVNVDGGMLAWHEAGRPLISESGAPAGVL
ncbi:rhodanese-like domain-containing protein [Streptomyces sp. PTM05]|uniref:Rhodanese-like domain-containing protein n=1 Tax=Streptantibioticus parmotrematis TaxID=2873249 RepID=A0ABS7QZK8_9ACTN|nr:rhodanese-like domain-containing protein [Streptantibioticus parmotrematis]MBY8888094.1 rhodanese-like domain-containing protein [Streptantibioticus parmotrematis]